MRNICLHLEKSLLKKNERKKKKTASQLLPAGFHSHTPSSRRLVCASVRESSFYLALNTNNSETIRGPILIFQNHTSESHGCPTTQQLLEVSYRAFLTDPPTQICVALFKTCFWLSSGSCDNQEIRHDGKVQLTGL